MLQRVQNSSGVVYYRSPLLQSLGVPHAFSTRIGGVSGGAFDSLNLGNPSDVPQRDDPDNIAKNYVRLQDAIADGELQFELGA